MVVIGSIYKNQEIQMMILTNYIYVQCKNENLKDSAGTTARTADCPGGLMFLVKLNCFRLFINLLNLKILWAKILHVE